MARRFALAAIMLILSTPPLPTASAQGVAVIKEMSYRANPDGTVYSRSLFIVSVSAEVSAVEYDTSVTVLSGPVSVWRYGEDSDKLEELLGEARERDIEWVEDVLRESLRRGPDPFRFFVFTEGPGEATIRFSIVSGGEVLASKDLHLNIVQYDPDVAPLEPFSTPWCDGRRKTFVVTFPFRYAGNGNSTARLTSIRLHSVTIYGISPDGRSAPIATLSVEDLRRGDFSVEPSTLGPNATTALVSVEIPRLAEMEAFDYIGVRVRIAADVQRDLVATSATFLFDSDVMRLPATCACRSMYVFEDDEMTDERRVEYVITPLPPEYRADDPRLLAAYEEATSVEISGRSSRGEVTVCSAAYPYRLRVEISGAGTYEAIIENPDPVSLLLPPLKVVVRDPDIRAERSDGEVRVTGKYTPLWVAVVGDDGVLSNVTCPEGYDPTFGWPLPQGPFNVTIQVGDERPKEILVAMPWKVEKVSLRGGRALLKMIVILAVAFFAYFAYVLYKQKREGESYEEEIIEEEEEETLIPKELLEEFQSEEEEP